MKVPFSKVESIGNDFVLIEDGVVSDEQLPEFALHACRRRFSVGADGLLVSGRRGPDALTLRMFNPDGSEDFCGNGLRCAALYGCYKGWVDSSFVIWHGGREVMAKVTPAGFETEIGFPSFLPADVPHKAAQEIYFGSIEVAGRTIEASAVTTGSTHLVIFTDALPGDEELKLLGPALEHHELFPERTSVIWVQEVADDRVKIRIWERGAGETLGCGTGSSAAAVVWFRKREAGGKVTVENRGGSVEVEMDSWYAPINVRGPAHLMFEAEIDFPSNPGQTKA